MERNLGEVDLDAGGIVEIVGEDVQRDVSDDLGRFRRHSNLRRERRQNPDRRCGPSLRLVRVRSEGRLRELREEHPDMTRKLLDLVCERFISTLLELETSSFHDLIPRLAKLLIERASGEWACDMTHQEIAEHLRVYRKSLTSAIGELRKAGIIEVKRKAVRILDQGRLERAAREGK